VEEINSFLEHMLSYDFHLHSTYSDGRATPEKLIAQARAHRVSHLALTDHDTTAGLRQFLRLARAHGLIATSGIEMSTRDLEIELHLLGYGFRNSDPKLAEWLRLQKTYRNQRAAKILSAFQQTGFEVSPLRPKKTTIGRPHIAREILRHAKNRQLLWERYRCEPDLNQLIGQLMHKPGQPFYVKKTMLATRAVISMIHQLGGIVMLAHPGYYKLTGLKLAALIKRLAAFGLDGMEVFHADYDPQCWKTYLRLANRHRLLISCGSDTHDLQVEGVGAITAPKRLVSASLQPFLERLWG
jgi:predicted metal-dependent phosphoesterase TrpH